MLTLKFLGNIDVGDKASPTIVFLTEEKFSDKGCF